MNTGQMLLALGALMLLSSMVLRFNRTVLTSDEVMYNSKFNVLAASLCTSLIDEAKSKAFDEKTDGAAISDITKLSPDLKTDGGENPKDNSTFNDFDDYNGYIRTDLTSIPGEVFYLTCKVNYVETTTAIKTTTSKQWNKLITVTVMSPSMKDSVQISSVYSYWYFR